jgi:hypothetical protein
MIDAFCWYVPANALIVASEEQDARLIDYRQHDYRQHDPPAA